MTTERTPESVGISKTVSWIMAIIATLLVAMGGIIFQGINARVATNEITLSIHSAQVARLEAKVESTDERTKEIYEQLQVINNKIDDLRRQSWRGRDSR